MSTQGNDGYYIDGTFFVAFLSQWGSADRPANPLRMSVTPAASHTLVDAGTGIINPTRAQGGTGRPDHTRRSR